MTKSTTRYSNNARTTLAFNILAGDTTIPVTSSVGFPSLSGSDCFYITIDDGTHIEVVKVTGISSNNLTGCVRGQEGTTAFAFLATAKVENRLTAGNITAFARLQDRLGSVNSVEDLLGPANSDGNSALCASTDAGAMPIVALANGAKWKLLNYPDVVKTGVIGAGSTGTSIPYANVGNYLLESTAKLYLIQFTSGACIGSCRFLTVNAGPQTVSWTTALPAALSSADTYEIYRCSSALKMPMGANTDKVFFENNANIWFDYSIPTGKNASSAGPITINSGVTITVPSGSSWSIV